MRNFTVLMVLFIITQKVWACDACGCSINGDSWGITPKYNIHFVGLRLQYRQFHNVHPNDHGTEGGMLTGDDYFYRTDLFGRFSLNKRFQLTASLPYRYNLRMEEGVKSVQSGIGDASLMLNYLPILPGNKDWKHALQISGGVEAPTGAFEFSHDHPANMQPGSGTWDYLGGLNYTLRYRNGGINLEGNYRYNGVYEKGYGYDWGNSYITAGKIFWVKRSTPHQKKSNNYLQDVTGIEKDSTTHLIMFWSGFASEHYESNIENTKYQIRAAYTGGYMISWNAGVDFYAENFGAALEFGMPIKSDLSDGYSKMKFHAGARLMFFIPSKNKKTIQNL